MLEKLILLWIVGTPFEDLMNGDWWGALTGVFTGTIGEFFFAIVFLLPVALIYIKTQNIVPASLALVAGGAVLAVLFTSPIRFFFAVIAIIGVATVLWGIHKGV